MSKNKDIIYPFGPPIGVFLVEEKHSIFVQNYVRHIIDSNIQSRFDHSKRLVGNVKQELSLLPVEGFELDYQNLIDLIDENAIEFFEKTFKKYGKIVGDEARKYIQVEERDIWIVRQFSGDYNPMHNHSRYDISGVLYTMVPDFISQDKPDRQKGARNGTIDFMFGNQAFLCDAKCNIRPKENMLLLFPSYLIHTVYPFSEEDKERQSLAFNLKLKFV